MNDAPDSLGRLDTVLCVSCKYDISSLPVGGRCPECGGTVLDVAATRQHHGKAKAALVLGILSLIFWWAYLLPPAICAFIAVLLARRSRREIESGRGAVTSLGMAVAAETCGWVGLSISIVYAGVLGIYLVLYVL